MNQSELPSYNKFFFKIKIHKFISIEIKKIVYSFYKNVLTQSHQHEADYSWCESEVFLRFDWLLQQG